MNDEDKSLCLSCLMEMFDKSSYENPEAIMEKHGITMDDLKHFFHETFPPKFVEEMGKAMELVEKGDKESALMILSKWKTAHEDEY